MAQVEPTSYGKPPMRVSYKAPFSLRLRYTISIEPKKLSCDARAPNLFLATPSRVSKALHIPKRKQNLSRTPWMRLLLSPPNYPIWTSRSLFSTLFEDQSHFTSTAYLVSLRHQQLFKGYHFFEQNYYWFYYFITELLQTPLTRFSNGSAG
jgi:hypothetical protein